MQDDRNQKAPNDRKNNAKTLQALKKHPLDQWTQNIDRQRES